MPDPVTKTVWQTIVEVHPETARRLGVTNGDHLKIETEHGSIEAPVWEYMGVRTDVVAIALGRGHSAYGRYAKDVGLDPLTLLGSAEDRAGGLVLTSTKARVSKTGEYSPLITTEGSARQHGRGIGRAVRADAPLDARPKSPSKSSAMRHTSSYRDFARRSPMMSRVTTAIRSRTIRGCTIPPTTRASPNVDGR